MKLKVCGMREKENIHQLLEMEPDYVGFIFYKKSKRFVDEFPIYDFPESIKKVGVFVNAEPDYVLDKVVSNGLDVIQLHGDETPGYCQRLNALLIENKRRLQMVKAFAVDEWFDFGSVKEFEEYCDFFLFDTKGKHYGGNSKRFDWSLLKNYHGKVPYFLSGGIGPEAVEDLKEFLDSSWALNCHAIDINSRFELSPGLKNIKMLENFKAQLS